MNKKIIITVGILVLVLVVGCLVYMAFDKDYDVYIFNTIKTKQLVQNSYIPPSSPKTSVIPMKLFQTWHCKEIPLKMQDAVNSIKVHNPELEYFLFDENDCINYIRKHFGNEVVNAYNKLIPGAYRADLWRYCVMYIDGGVYLDIKYQCVDGFKFVDIMNREHFVLERQYPWKPGTHGIYNALIIAKPGNPIFLSAINKIVNNTKTNFYGYNSLYPTGPGLLGELYFGNIYKNMDMLDNFDLVYNLIDTKDTIIYKNQIILQSYPEYRREQRMKQKQPHYGQLWYSGAIYGK